MTEHNMEFYFRIDFLQNPPSVPTAPIPARVNPGVVTQSAVDVATDLLPPTPAQYDSASIANQQRAALAHLMQLQAQALLSQSQSTTPPAIAQQQTAQAATPGQVKLTLPDLQSFVRSQGTRVKFAKKKGADS